MTASYIPILPSEIPLTRRPLRLRMTEDPGRNRLNAASWPQSRDLATELADLGDHFPPGLGRIVRALLSPAEWDPAPRHIPVAGGDLKVGSFPCDDTHLIHLTISDRTALYVLVVPPGFTADQGDEALLAAATAGNVHSAADLLEGVTEWPTSIPGITGPTTVSSYGGSGAALVPNRTEPGDSLCEYAGPRPEST